MASKLLDSFVHITQLFDVPEAFRSHYKLTPPPPVDVVQLASVPPPIFMPMPPNSLQSSLF